MDGWIDGWIENPGAGVAHEKEDLVNNTCMLSMRIIWREEVLIR